MAVAVAGVVAPPPVNVTIGFEVYPEPPEMSVTDVTVPLVGLIVAVAVAGMPGNAVLKMLSILIDGWTFSGVFGSPMTMKMGWSPATALSEAMMSWNARVCTPPRSWIPVLLLFGASTGTTVC